MKRTLRIVLAVLACLALIAGVVIYRELRHPSLEPYRSLEIKPAPHKKGALRLMHMGVTTILLDDDETAIMTDGFFSRPSLLTVALRKIAPDQARIDYAMSRTGVQKLAAVFVAHSHYDHAMDSPEVARQKGALLIGSKSTANIAQGQAFPDAQFRTVNGGEEFAFGRFKITVISSRHAPEGRYMGDITTALRPPARVGEYKEGGSYSYLIDHDGQRILIHPSANFIPGFLKNVHVDVIFLGIGTLGEQCDQFIKDYWREVVQATGAKVVIPIHWDDFWRPLNEPLLPMPALADDFDRGMKYILQLAEHDHVAVRLMPLFGSVDISDITQ